MMTVDEIAFLKTFTNLKRLASKPNLTPETPSDEGFVGSTAIIASILFYSVWIWSSPVLNGSFSLKLE